MSPYIQRLTSFDSPEQEFKRPWFYPGELYYVPLTDERLEEERKEARNSDFSEMHFDIDRIINEAVKRSIPADYGKIHYDDGDEPETH